MYDILQLNDLLVPELLDIAEQLTIPNAKKLNKQELVYKILDKQAIMKHLMESEWRYNHRGRLEQRLRQLINMTHSLKNR